MTGPTLSKAGLARERRRLATYQHFLPALDLKRRQLIGVQMRTRRELAALRQARAERATAAVERLPMLGYEAIGLDGLVTVRTVRLEHEDLVGVRLPRLATVELDRLDYGLLSRPHWVDDVADALAEVLTLEVRIGVARERLERLDEAVRRMTRRVNLFDKVLIPEARSNLHRIRVALGDAERAAVVQAKIAKRKKQRLARGFA